MKKLKTCLTLFFIMFKIGLFTFGGGYAMIAIIERELVERKKWLSHEEFLDIVAIAESSPGPLAINSATFVGYKIGKFLGSLFATLGVVLPSFIIIFTISFFFDAFLGLEYVGYAFKGIQACVAFLILSAGIKMAKKLKKTLFNILMLSIATACLVAFTLFAVSFSTIFYILIGGAIGLFAYLFVLIKKKTKKNDLKKEVNINENIEVEKSFKNEVKE